MNRNPTDAVELWVRAFEPGPTDDKRVRAVDRIERLEGAIESVAVEPWGRAVEETDRLDGVPRLRTIRRRLAAFDDWADRTDRELRPFFRREHVESAITGRSTVVRRLPTLALAEFDGDDLVHVAPCREGERTVDVFDRLETLAAGHDVVSFDADERDRVGAGEREPVRDPVDERNADRERESGRVRDADRSIHERSERVGPPR